MFDANVVAAVNEKNTNSHAENELLNELRALQKEIAALRAELRSVIRSGSLMVTSLPESLK
jgi:hypothetical protein